MPVEIRELLIKATVAVDWNNQIVTTVNKEAVCIKLPHNKEVLAYVKKYFRKSKTRELLFDESRLSEFLIEWKKSLIDPAKT